MASRRVVVVGCVATKLDRPAQAKDLYVSPLFARRRRYAEASGDPWVIFSAKHGIVGPDDVIDPYDVSLRDATASELRELGLKAADQLRDRFGELSNVTFEVHAGEPYVVALRQALAAEANLEWPTQGLVIGRQLQWYDAKPASSGHVPAPTADSGGSAVIAAASELSAFTYRWPTDTESFSRGWQLAVFANGRTFDVKVGFGRRPAFGRDRARVVVWVDGQPQVEGASADDYEQSGALISMLRIEGGRMPEHLGELPAGYEGFEVVVARDEIRAPYSRRRLAVRIGEDDLTAWVRHALLRLWSRRAEGPASSHRKALATPRSRLAPPPQPDQRRVAAALLAFGASEQATAVEGSAVFTPNLQADELVRSDPFAFLLAVIFDQGIEAERAWAAPYHLRERLGHLDPARIAAEPDAVAMAINTPPKLQRYVNTVPVWVVKAAERVLSVYGGDAARIWASTPDAADLQRRLDEFVGIGQKKAAMAVAMLERDLRVNIAHLSGNDIAYDIHIRRVFLRTGLATHDDPDEMITIARALSPTQPALLDLPAWLIGRQWCRPGTPACPDCPLLGVCPRLIESAANL